jgi:hypothetical protein
MLQMNAFIQSQANSIYDAVYAVFGDDDAKVTGKRRDDGATVSRDLEMRAKVIVGEATEFAGDIVAAPINEHGYPLEIKRDNWLDSTPPQVGDVFEIDGYQEMRCVGVIPKPYGWTVNCVTKGGAL